MDIRKGDIVILDDGMTVRVTDVVEGNEDAPDNLFVYTNTLFGTEDELKVANPFQIVWNETAISRSPRRSIRRKQMDLLAIANACAVECERQEVGLYELGQLIKAYDRTVNLRKDAFQWTGGFVEVGRIVEPEKNRYGYRISPVTFANGGSSANSQDIERLMNALVQAIRDGADIDAIVEHFLWIHPFKDGNGRVGFLLYNFLNGSLNNPVALPSYF